jgi:hypothetical protein
VVVAVVQVIKVVHLLVVHLQLQFQVVAHILQMVVKVDKLSPEALVVRVVVVAITVIEILQVVVQAVQTAATEVQMLSSLVVQVKAQQHMPLEIQV